MWLLKQNIIWNVSQGIETNTEAAKGPKPQASDNETLLQALVFAELVSYVESSVETGTYIFKLSELHCMYEERLRHVGVDKTINKTRLKMKILERFDEKCQEQSDGKNVLFVFNEGLMKLLKEATETRDFDSEALAMVKLIKAIRRDIFEWDGFDFDGTMPDGCQESSIPTSLKGMVSMLLNGPNLKDQDGTVSQACLTIAQLIYFNVKHKTKPGVSQRHSQLHEPPVPIYLGLNIHTQTRSKKMVKCLHKLGICISYQRVMEIENMLATAVCKRFSEDGLVCPPILRKGIFTVGALDNIDHNPSSTTAQGSFHGTGISIFQFPTSSNSGVVRDPIAFEKDHTLSTSDHTLPENYTIVPAVSFKTHELKVPDSNRAVFHGRLDTATVEEAKWTESGIVLMQKDNLQKDDFISWAAYHASNQPEPTDPVVINVLLPLFYEKAARLAKIKHGMDTQKQITSFLNPGQIPVMAFDQPLFALAKFVQWHFHETLGEEHFVVMFGGLHIEMALWHAIGELLDGCGWTTALCDAGVASSGTADSFLKVTHLTKTRHSHQLTALALSKLQRDAWQIAVEANSNISFEDWKKDMEKQSPTFKFWTIILEFEKLVLVFVRAHRTGDFNLYVESLEALTPWFFALDRTNYARWIPIHIRDMKSLPVNIKEDFARCWVVSKTSNRFSSMPIDQCHEQNNELVKGSGGAIGLT